MNTKIVSPEDLRALKDELTLLRMRNRELQDNLVQRDNLITDLTASNNGLQDEVRRSIASYFFTNNH